MVLRCFLLCLHTVDPVSCMFARSDMAVTNDGTTPEISNTAVATHPIWLQETQLNGAAVLTSDRRSHKSSARQRSSTRLPLADHFLAQHGSCPNHASSSVPYQKASETCNHVSFMAPDGRWILRVSSVAMGRKMSSLVAGLGPLV